MVSTPVGLRASRPHRPGHVTWAVCRSALWGRRGEVGGRGAAASPPFGRFCQPATFPEINGGQGKLNSLSQNSHQGISNAWEKHTEDTVCEKCSPRMATAIEGTHPPRGSYTPQPWGAAAQPPGGRGQMEERQEGAWDTAQPCRVKQPAQASRPRQGPGRSRAQRSPRGGQQESPLHAGDSAMAVRPENAPSL